MVDYSTNQNVVPVVKGVSYFLAHVPSMIRHGSKPSREIEKAPSLLPPILDHLQTFDQAVAYPPNQVFIGNLDPDDLLHISPPSDNPLSPWSHHQYSLQVNFRLPHQSTPLVICPKLSVSSLQGENGGSVGLVDVS